MSVLFISLWLTTSLTCRHWVLLSASTCLLPTMHEDWQPMSLIIVLIGSLAVTQAARQCRFYCFLYCQSCRHELKNEELKHVLNILRFIYCWFVSDKIDSGIILIPHCTWHLCSSKSGHFVVSEQSVGDTSHHSAIQSATRPLSSAHWSTTSACAHKETYHYYYFIVSFTKRKLYMVLMATKNLLLVNIYSSPW